MDQKIWWKCSSCGYRFQEAVEKGIPTRCPSCGAECTFSNATCYTPECGGPESGNYDPKI